MIESNKFFHHGDRASYELSFLLRALPQHFTTQTALSSDQVQMINAADSHASNLGNSLMHGLEAIGHLMYSAGVNEKAPADPAQFSALGVLISELAGQLQFLDEFRSSVADRQLQIATKGQAE